MKLRMVVEVALPKDEHGDHRNLREDQRQIEMELPPTAVVISSEHVTEPDDMRAAFKKLLRFKLEMFDALPKDFKKSDYYEKGDEDAPFYSEALLYNLIGKEDARTVLAYLHNLMRQAGLDPHDVEREVSAEVAAEEEIEGKRQERIAARKKFVSEFAKKKGWEVDVSWMRYTEAQMKEIREALREAKL